MKIGLMDILVCPLCKGDLILNAVEENKGEISIGTLYCMICKENYPISGGIPNLLPPEFRK